MQVFGQFVPAFHIGKERSRPSARDIVGQEVVGHIRPSNRVIFGDAGPCNTVKLAGLHRHFDVFPWQVDWHDTKAGQETARCREGKDPLAFQISQTADRIFGGKMARIPCAGRDVFNADGRILFVPDFVQAVLVEKHRHIERIARSEREIPAKDCDFGRGCHRIVIRLDRINGAALQRLKQLAGRDQLICEKQLDLHPVACDLVEHFNRRNNHLGGQ